MKDFETSGFTKSSLWCAMSACDLIPRFKKKKTEKNTEDVTFLACKKVINLS